MAKLAILDSNYILKEVQSKRGSTDKNNFTVALPDNADIDNFIGNYYYNYEVGAFFPIAHIDGFARAEDYDTGIVDALVCAVCSLLDGKKPDIPSDLLIKLRERCAAITKKDKK